MSKTKKIRTVELSGSLSDYVDIGADASNVDLLNGKNVEQAIQDINDAGYIDKEVTELTNYYDKKEIDEKLTSAFYYKGEVETYDALSELTDTAKKGDTYNIKQASEHNKAGDNAVFNGTDWDVLSGVVDLTDYYTKTQTDEAIAFAVTGALNEEY